MGSGIAPTGRGAATDSRRVVVTGAGGFVGRQVVAKLAADGHRVIAVSRQARDWPDGVAPMASPPLGREVAAAADAWAGILAGADAVVHLAAMAHLPVDTFAARRALWQVNVRATEHLARAAVRAGVADLIFVSSIKAVGERSESGHPLTETSVPGVLDCYGIAKRAAERRLERIGRAAPATRITMLRPPLVYGPGVGANMAALARLAARGVPLPFAAITNRRSLIYVGNLVDAIVTVLAKPDVAGGVYHVCDAAPVSTPSLVRALASAQHRRVRLVPVPLSLLSRLARWAGRDAQWSRIAGSLESSDAKFRAAFGWQAPFSLAQGLARQFAPAASPADRPLNR